MLQSRIDEYYESVSCVFPSLISGLSPTIVLGYSVLYTKHRLNQYMNIFDRNWTRCIGRVLDFAAQQSSKKMNIDSHFPLWINIHKISHRNMKYFYDSH
jgi:hypothetical protein